MIVCFVASDAEHLRHYPKSIALPGVMQQEIRLTAPGRDGDDRYRKSQPRPRQTIR